MYDQKLRLLRHIMEVKRHMLRAVLNPNDVDAISLRYVNKLLYDWLIGSELGPRLRADMGCLCFSFVGEFQAKKTIYRGIVVNEKNDKAHVLSSLTNQELVSFSYNEKVAERFATYDEAKQETGAIIQLTSAHYVQTFDLYQFLDQYVQKFGNKLPATLLGRIDDLRFEQEVLVFANRIQPSNFAIHFLAGVN